MKRTRYGSVGAERRRVVESLVVRAPRGVAGVALAAVAALLVGTPRLGAQQSTERPLTLPDVIALALQNNPQTRLATAQARATAAQLGSARGRFFPTLTVTPTMTKSESVSPVGRNLGSFSTDRFTYGPSASLQFLLLDFGGRSGTVGEAREALVAADYSSDATVQNTVLLAEAAFFSYNSARDLLDAQQANVVTAQENRTAAEQRFRVGLATVADTLQASTALAQAQLSLLQTEGDLQTARGNLAAAIGTSANTPFQIARDSTPAPVGAVTESVDTLIARAVLDRPDLGVARAQTASAVDAIKVARSAALPSFTFGGNAGRVVSNPSQFTGNSYSMTLGLNLPVFNGGSYEYDIQAAKALADVARAREEVTRVQIANQVFTSYAGLQTAAARVTTSAALLASAVKSEDVARGRYDEGVGTFLDLLTAQNALAAARSQAAQTRWAWYTALGQLAHDVGVLDKRGDPHLPGAMTPGPKPLPSGQR